MAALLLILALCPAPPVVAFGDSITVGYGARTTAAMWVNQVGAALDNQAVAGSTVAEQVDVMRGYAGGAQSAYWFSCANDLLKGTKPEAYAAALREGVGLLQEKGLRVSLGTCLKMRTYPALASAELQAAYSAAVREVAAETGARLVDIDALYDPRLHEAAFLPYHPNDEGHTVIARAFRGYVLWFPWVG
jgi:lysophospholipase L1-like esterase